MVRLANPQVFDYSIMTTKTDRIFTNWPIPWSFVERVLPQLGFKIKIYPKSFFFFFHIKLSSSLIREGSRNHWKLGIFLRVKYEIDEKKERWKVWTYISIQFEPTFKVGFIQKTELKKAAWTELYFGSTTAFYYQLCLSPTIWNYPCG